MNLIELTQVYQDNNPMSRTTIYNFFLYENNNSDHHLVSHFMVARAFDKEIYGSKKVTKCRRSLIGDYELPIHGHHRLLSITVKLIFLTDSSFYSILCI